MTITIMGLEAQAVIVDDVGEIRRVSDPDAERVYRANVDARRDEVGSGPNKARLLRD
jgi:hypothetical protein